MNVLLVGVGRNLNRAIRTCYTFGVEKLYLIDCEKSYVKNGLFSAKNKIELIHINSIEGLGEIVAFEVNGKSPFSELKNADCIAIGGENIMLSKQFDKRIRIDTPNNLCLTTEAALAIALYAYATQT